MKETIEMMNINLPIRVGKKEKRGVLDSNGLEIVIFPKGMENYAQFFCDTLNGVTLEDAFNAGLSREASYEIGKPAPDFNDWFIDYLKKSKLNNKTI